MNRISNNMSQIRFTGLSGFDSESVIEQLMNAEKMPLNGLFQKRTVVEWKRDAYREVTNSLKGFKTSFFDIVNRSSYMLSSSSVKILAAKSSSTSNLEVAANQDAQEGTTTVKVLQLATADKAVTQTKLSKDITGTVSNFNMSGKSIRLTLDGVTKEISLSDYTSDTIASGLQSALNSAFGSGKLTVSFNTTGNQISIGTEGGATTVTAANPLDTLSALGDLGITAGATNRISTSKTLSELKDLFNVPMTFSLADTVEFTINGKLITAKSSDTLSSVFEKINNTTEANVTIKYDELTDKVSISSKQLGDGDNLTLDDENGNFLAAMGINLAAPISAQNQGMDAKVLINGTQEIVRSTNSFTLNGIAYTLKATHATESTGDTVTVVKDVDQAFNNIKSFIEKYNELLDKLNGKISEKYDRNYLPLSDEQKESMKDADIEKWEEKAKTGLLKNDSILQKIVLDMRTALYENVEGVGITLKDIGIASSSYTDKGKLFIDEDKLKEALRSKPDEVAKLLNGVDPSNPAYKRTLTADQKKSRYTNSGVFQRLSDIFEDNISTIRDAEGKKGFLLEKAGIEGDITFFNNLIDDELDQFDKRINTMLDRIEKKEESYYLKFSKLETMLNQMNSQSSWLASQFGGGQ